jgi:hypothetical protein
MKSYLYDFDPNNCYLPIELHVLSFIFTNKLNSLSKINITTFINNIYRKENFLYLLEKNNNIDIIEYHKKELEYYLNNFINLSIENIITNILKYHSTWDNYRLSIVYLKIISQIELNSFFIKFNKLLFQNIHPNPLERLSIEKTKEEFYQYF